MGNKYDPNFPLAHRTDLPEHERRISAKSLKMLEDGIQAVKEGRTKVVDLKEFDDKKWGPSLITKFLRVCRLNGIILKYFGSDD